MGKDSAMFTHQLESPLPDEVRGGIWNWEKLWKKCGASGSPGATLEESREETGCPGLSRFGILLALAI
jgi:hypothetical protein